MDARPEKYDRYIEPFLGGAAIFFALRPKRAILSDLNSDLISTYSAIRKDWRLVQRYLNEFASSHCEDNYYAERYKTYRSEFKNAAHFIYLNRVCWNGLYRVNLKGQFNVPLGTKTRVLLDSDDFSTVAAALKNAKLLTCDFEKAINDAERNDFVFVDPPYITAHNFNGFVKYNETLFSWEDQLRLRDAVAEASSRGVRILMSNADHGSIRSLYRGLGSIQAVSRASIIAGGSEFRNKTTELLLKTYP
jgi:DNA adenine methylase